MNFVKALMVFLVTFLVIDAVWINLIALDLYHRDVGSLMTQTPRMGPAMLFYIGYAAAAIHLVVRPASQIKQAGLNGAVLGAVAYGTFAVSNFALLESWTSTLLTIDLMFGTTVTAICCCVAFKLSGQSNSTSKT